MKKNASTEFVYFKNGNEKKKQSNLTPKKFFKKMPVDEQLAQFAQFAQLARNIAEAKRCHEIIKEQQILSSIFALADYYC